MGDPTTTLRALADACEDCDVANTTMTDEDECAREQRQLLWCALPGGAWRSAAAELRTMADTVEALVRERDRLARVLAVEGGDEAAAPEGWRTKSDRVVTVWHRGPWSVYRHRSGMWRVFRAGSSGWTEEHETALEAMEAADRAGGSDV